MEGNDHSPNIGRDFLYYVNPLTMFGGYDLTVTGRITDKRIEVAAFLMTAVVIGAAVIVGNCVTAVEIKGGAIHITLGNRINRHILGKTISIRPAVVPVSNKVPIAWVRGYASVPAVMTAKGENRTDLLARHLPIECRT